MKIKTTEGGGVLFLLLLEKQRENELRRKMKKALDLDLQGKKRGPEEPRVGSVLSFSLSLRWLTSLCKVRSG